MLSFLSRLFSAPTKSPEEIEMIEREQQKLRDFLDEHVLPVVGLHTTIREPGTPATASVLGGPAWRPDGAAWPIDAGGAPMLFLAQINFSELPPLPEFPETGLLQFFVEGRSPWGGQVGYPERGKEPFQIDWWPEPRGGESRLVEFRRRDTPFRRSDFLQGSRFVPGAGGAMRPPLSNFLLDDYIEQDLRERLGDAVEDIYEGVVFEVEDPGDHWVGGHADFNQVDVRLEGEDRDFDRVLLRIGTDDQIMFADSGIANFLIRAGDLRDRNFRNVLFTWDCS